jgi:hypothetical protein
MDIAGAQALSRRIAQQEHWRQAHAVRIGQQPSVDPDGHDLESFGAGVRTYRPQSRLEVHAGRTTKVTRRIRKLLVDGVWKGEVVVLGVQDVA